MTDNELITNRMLLEHMQTSKQEMLQKFSRLEQRFEEESAWNRRQHARIQQQFVDARQHRQALQEDLEATIRTQFTHQKQLAVFTGQPTPED